MEGAKPPIKVGVARGATAASMRTKGGIAAAPHLHAMVVVVVVARRRRAAAAAVGVAAAARRLVLFEEQLADLVHLQQRVQRAAGTRGGD